MIEKYWEFIILNIHCYIKNVAANEFLDENDLLFNIRSYKIYNYILYTFSFYIKLL